MNNGRQRLVAFLIFIVSTVYVALGITGVFRGVSVLAYFTSMYGVVNALPLIDFFLRVDYGPPADRVFVLQLMGFWAFIGGVLGLWSARKLQYGMRSGVTLWAGLVIMSWIVVLWNLVWLALGRYSHKDYAFLVLISAGWASVYTALYFFARRAFVRT